MEQSIEIILITSSVIPNFLAISEMNCYQFVVHRVAINSIFFTSHEVSRTNLIDQILQMPRIECCSNVEIKLNKIYGSIILSLQLPIESISNWLHRNCDGIKDESKERLLRIYSSGFLFSWSIRALCDHLKKVINSFTFFRKFFKNSIFSRGKCLVSGQQTETTIEVKGDEPPNELKAFENRSGRSSLNFSRLFRTPFLKFFFVILYGLSQDSFRICSMILSGFVSGILWTRVGRLSDPFGDSLDYDRSI